MFPQALPNHSRTVPEEGLNKINTYSDAQKTLVFDLVDEGELEADIYSDEAVIAVKLPEGKWWECGTKTRCDYAEEEQP